MATITSNGTGGGTFSTGATWIGGSAPSISDVAVIQTGDTVTMTASHTTDGSGGFTIQTGAILEGDAGVTIRAGGAGLTVSGSGILRHSGTGSGPFVIEELGGQTSTLTGTDASNLCSLKGTSTTNYIQIIPGNTASGAGRIFIDFCDMQFVGNASNEAFNPRLFTGTPQSWIKNSVMNQCGSILFDDVIAAGAVFQLNENNVTGALDDVIKMGADPAALSGGTREILDNYIEGRLASVGTTQSFADFTIDRNVFVTGSTVMSILDSPKPASLDSNLFVKTTSSTHFIPADWTNNYILENHSNNNPQLVSLPDRAGSFAFTGNIFENGGTATNGDGILLPTGSAAMTLAVTGNIVLPGASGGISCTLVSALGDSNKLFSAIDHNTYFVSAGAVGISMAETYNGYAGMIASARSNIAWSVSASGAVVFSSGTPVDGYVTVADYNVGYDTAGDQPLTDNYSPADSKFGSTPGGNDINEDPQFVDSTRDFASWDASNGGAGTIANGLAELAKMNLPSWDTDYTPTAAVTWVRGGFAPQNPNHKDAGHDSVTIGAVAFAAATGHGPLLAHQRNRLIRVA